MNLHDLKSRSRSSTPLSAAGRKKPRTLLHIKSRREMSDIERLPVEILQRIFLMDLNFSLPRASPIIAAKLSSEYIYDQCLLQTYSLYWEKSMDDLLPHLPHHVQNAEEPSKEKQSAILRCRWFNFERIRRVETQWLARREKIDELAYRQPRLQMVELRYTKITDDFFDEDWECFQISLPDMEYFNWNEWGIKSGDENGFLDAERPALLTFREDKVEIPGGLVNGEWTKEKVKLLFYLWRAGARIEKFSSTAGEEAAAGLREAIISANIQAVYLLIKLKIYIPLTTQLICQFLENCYYSPRGSIYTENFDVFKSFFTDCSYCKWYQAADTSDSLKTVSRMRTAEVEREILELRKQAASEGKRKKLLAWEVQVLEDIYRLKKT